MFEQTDVTEDDGIKDTPAANTRSKQEKKRARDDNAESGTTAEEEQPTNSSDDRVKATAELARVIVHTLDVFAKHVQLRK